MRIRIKNKAYLIAVIVSVVLFILILSRSSQAQDYECGVGSSSFDGTGMGAQCGLGNFQSKIIYLHLYQDQASALSAATSKYNSYDVGDCSHAFTASGAPSSIDSHPWVTSWNWEIWDMYQTWASHCCSTGTNLMVVDMYVYPDPNWLDLNNDCINDLNDDCTNECYVIWKGVKDSSDNWLYTVVVTTEGRVMHYGDPTSATDCLNGDIAGCTIYENYLAQVELDQADPETCDNTCDVSTDLGVSPSSPGSGEEEITPPEEEKGTQGQDAEVGDTDTELLEKITDNTSEIADNTDGLEEGLTELERQLIEANNHLEDIANNYNSGGTSLGTPTSNDRDRANALNSATETTDLEDYEFTSADAPETSTIGTLLDSISAQNPINDFLDNIQVTYSNPVCSVENDFTFMEQNFEFDIDLCDYEDTLDIMGDILFMIAVIMFIIIIFT
jgi:hypothetical protein